MIFYFTGTGNSYAAALQLQLRLQDSLFNIAECEQNNRHTFELKENESVGIVCPVYYGGLPSIVADFLGKLSFDRPPQYLYGVLTCGGSAADAGGMLKKILKDRGFTLSACWEVKMPANYAILYEPTKDEAAEPILEKAEERMEEIAGQILEQKGTLDSAGPVSRLVTAVLYPMYNKARKTKGFYTDDQCIGCGVCAGRCPVKAIEMMDGKPVWVRDKCVFCMSCVRCGAIQYKNKLAGRSRYRHPVFRKKKQQTAGKVCH